MRFVCLTLLAMLGSAALALPKVEIERIRGFEVHFVDTGAGNTFAVTAYVPLGSLHEGGRFLGRAHFLEHLMHTGTLRFPGYETFDNMLLPVGFETNAYTGTDRTFYFAQSHQSQAQTTLNAFLSMWGGLEWNPVTFAKEKDVVIEEVVSQYMKKTESFAAYNMKFTKLLPADHPWSHPMLGNLQSLKQLSIKDLQQLYHGNYTRHHVKFAVIGNFSNPAQKQQIRQWTVDALNPFRLTEELRKLPTLANKPVASLFSAEFGPPESLKRLHVRSEKLRWSSVTLEGTLALTTVRRYALEMLASYLNLNTQGSLWHALKTEGLITSGAAHVSTFKNRAWIDIYADFTPVGEQRRHEIQERIFMALRNVQLNGPDPEVIELLKASKLRAIDENSLTADRLVDTYASALADHKDLNDLYTSIRGLTPKAVQQAAQLFTPEMGLYLDVGPIDGELTVDEDHGLAYRIEDNEPQLRAYLKVTRSQTIDAHTYRPTIKAPFALPAAQPVERMTASNSKLLLRVQPDLPDSSAQFRFTFQPEDAAQLVALDLWLQAFSERMKDAAYAASLHHTISFNFDRRGHHLTIQSGSLKPGAPYGLKWLLEQMASFEPSREELERARVSYVQAKDGAYIGEMSSSKVVREALFSIHPWRLTDLAERDVASSLDLATVHGLTKQLWQKTQRQLAAVGHVSPQDVEDLSHAARHLSPTELSSVELPDLGPQGIEFTQRDFPEGIGAGGYALARIYSGPKVTSVREFIALKVLNQILALEITHLNRSQRALGYTHSSTMVALPQQRGYLLFVGQTETRENARLTIDGWDTVLKRLQSGELADEKIEQGIAALKNMLNQEQTTASDLADTYLSHLHLVGDAHINKKYLRELDSLTAKEVRELAIKYLLLPTTPHRTLVLGDCSSPLRIE